MNPYLPKFLRPTSPQQQACDRFRQLQSWRHPGLPSDIRELFEELDAMVPDLERSTANLQCARERLHQLANLLAAYELARELGRLPTEAAEPALV